MSIGVAILDGMIVVVVVTVTVWDVSVGTIGGSGVEAVAAEIVVLLRLDDVVIGARQA